MPMLAIASKDSLPDEIAVVSHMDLDAVRQARLAHTLAGELRLGRRERHPDRLHAVLASGMDHEASPAAADVQHALALAQAQLRADELALCLLGLLERLRAAREQRAAVGHRLVEEQREELV